MRAAAVLACSVLVTSITMLMWSDVAHSKLQAFCWTLLVSLPMTAVLAMMATRPIRRVLFAVSEGLLGFRERDFGLRLRAEREDEAGEVVKRFNALGEMLRREHHDTYQRQILVETVIEAAPMAIVLCNEANTVLLANVAARDLFFAGGRLDGHDFAEVLASWPSEVSSAILNGDDSLLAVERDGARETLHASKRVFELSTQPHVLYIVKPLTRELVRQEIAVWKNTIRVISHELNNSLAPISSLVHSARAIVGRPEHAHRLDEVFATIEERTKHLKSFLDGYAKFARLPKPSKQASPWSELLDGVRALYPFQLEGELPRQPGWFDPVQLQQVLINLVKNAAEAGSALDAITVAIRATPGGGTELAVMDRGAGMSEDVLEKALLPFYSTKKGGSGLGLPLCREIIDAHGGHLSVEQRQGGGIAVRCWLPGGP